MLLIKIIRKLKHILGNYLIEYPRIIKYRLLSNCKNVTGKPKRIQPIIMLGEGQVEIGKEVIFGVNPSPFLYSGYGFIEVRKKHSKITVGNNVWVNNNIVIISEGEGIEIGSQTIIGCCVEITDSDFHDLHPRRRMGGVPKTAKVVIGKNVFIGSNVKILKGVTIGDNSVIANSSVVTKSIPENVIAAGFPCKVLKSLELN